MQITPKMPTNLETPTPIAGISCAAALLKDSGMPVSSSSGVALTNTLQGGLYLVYIQLCYYNDSTYRQGERTGPLHKGAWSAFKRGYRRQVNLTYWNSSQADKRPHRISQVCGQRSCAKEKSVE
jgi:hypothetical protein